MCVMGVVVWGKRKENKEKVERRVIGIKGNAKR